MSEHRACEGDQTLGVFCGGEHMQECIACGTRIRDDMVDHPFFGFGNGCDCEKKLDDA